ncbi:hypothetical protein [Anaeroselena agilis]|uniref:Uncharacterized protein n=1 Tax=Anaeroselena agilis TaxID=3063788 RepID=A0ABU3P074_9FIRM|nr:hypothetical protein [Selenomonadales bacterium 4137-cl]
MSDRDRSEYVRFPEKVKTGGSLGSATKMVAAARRAERTGQRLGDAPAATVSQDAFAAAEEVEEKG